MNLQLPQVGVRWFLVMLGIFAAVREASADADGRDAGGVHQYVFFDRERERISDAAFLKTKSFEGAQLKYPGVSWSYQGHL